MGGMKKKRPGLTLSAMSGTADGSNASTSPSNGVVMGGGAGFMRPEEGGTPFSNFRKIV